MTTLTSSPSPVKTRILFDATTHRNRLESFGLGLVDLTEGLPTCTSCVTGAQLWLVGDVWTSNVRAELALQAKRAIAKANAKPELLITGPAVEATPKSTVELRAFELGRRAGYGRIEAGRIMSFAGWSEAAITSYWLGHRTGWQQSDAERLAEQAELDAKYDAMYAASHQAYEDENYRVDFGWEAERGGVA